MAKEFPNNWLSKGQINQISDLLTELRSINPTSNAISILTTVQKQQIEIERLKKRLSSAGFLKKRGIKKELSNAMENYDKNVELLINSLLSGYRDVHYELLNNIKEIAKFLPNEPENIKKITLPNFAVKDVIRFASDVLSIYSRVSSTLREKSIALLQSNQEIITIYEKFIDFDSDKIQVTKQTTKEHLQLLSITELISRWSGLQTENSYLKQRQKGTEGKIQLAIIEIATVLQQHLDTIKSIGLSLGGKIDNFSERVQSIIKQAESTKSVEELLSLEKQCESIKKELLNLLRSHEISLKTDTENQIGRILTTIGREDDIKIFQPPPEIDVSLSDIPSVIQDIERLKSWHQRQMITIKRMITTTELLNTAKTIQAMKIPIPDDFEERCHSLQERLDKANDLTETVNLFKEFYEMKMIVAESSRNHLFRLLENPHVQDAINSKNGPKPPTIRNFETLSLGELINITREIKDWETRLINYFSDTSDINELVFHADKARQMEVDIPEEFYSEISRIRSELSQNDLRKILELQESRIQLRNKLSDYIRNKILVLKTVIDGVPSLQFPYDRISSVASPGVLIKNLEEIINWMEKISNNLAQEIQNTRMNLISLFDSRDEFRRIIPERLKEKIEEYRDKAPTRVKDFKVLVREIESLNTLLSEIKSHISQEIINEVHIITTQLNSLETIPPKLKAHAPILALDDIKYSTELSTDAPEKYSVLDLLEKYEKIPVWKYKISSRIRENLKAIQFPLIPIETKFDLREKRNLIISLIDQYSESGNLEAVVKEYIAFLTAIEETRSEITVEIKKEIDNLKFASSKLTQLMGSRVISLNYTLKKDLDDMDYSEALTEYWQLKSFLERKLAILVEQTVREISSHYESYSKLPKQYVKYFKSLLDLIELKKKEIKSSTTINELVNIYQNYSLESIQLSRNSLAKMHQTINSRIRVSLPRINEVIPIDRSVFDAERKISTFTFEENSHDQLAHKARQLIFLYDTEIVAALLEQAMTESRLALKNINDLREKNIDIIAYVGKYIENFSRVIVGREEDVSLQELTDVFIEMDQMQGDTLACDIIRSAAHVFIEQIQRAIIYIKQHYDIDIKEREDINFNYLDTFVEKESINHIGRLTDAVLRIVEIRDAVIKILQEIEQKEYQRLEEELEQLNYYSNIKEVFQRYQGKESENIFPREKLMNYREKFQTSTDLGEMLDAIVEIEKMKAEWKELSTKLNRWHRAIIMFLPRYSLTTNSEENIRQFKEIKKKIFDTYTKNKTIREYLALLVRMYIEKLSGTTITIS